MVAAVHRYNYCSLPCRHVSCSAGAVFGPMCYLPGFNVIQQTRGKHEFEKQKWFLGQGCDTRTTDKHSTQYMLNNMHVREVTR